MLALVEDTGWYQGTTSGVSYKRKIISASAAAKPKELEAQFFLRLYGTAKSRALIQSETIQIVIAR